MASKSSGGEAMKLSTLKKLVAEGESQRLEFKTSTSDLRGAMETVCAFLNAAGGELLFGVGSDGRIRGQSISDNTLRELAAEIARIEPLANIDIQRIKISDTNEVLALRTTGHPSAPYTYNGRAFRRVTSTTKLMPQSEYHRRLLERDQSQQRWENQLADNYDLRDLDQKEIRRTVREGLDSGRIQSSITGAGETLRRLHLIRGHRPIQAAIVAFAKDVEPYYPQCCLRMARFKGIVKTEFLDQRQMSGHAFRLLEEALLFLRRHLPIAGRFAPGVMERQDEPLFPLLALREALVNAFCHRDYSVTGGAVSIAIFDNRLEIASTETLPYGLTVADLKTEHTSRPRNPLLAEVFYRRGLIERWGRGTQRLVELCVEAGHPEPEFEERIGEVVVRFLPSAYIPPHRISHDLTERQRRILHALSGGGRCRLSEILAAFDDPPPRTTIKDDLRMLRDWGLVESGGRGPGARWWLRIVP